MSDITEPVCVSELAEFGRIVGQEDLMAFSSKALPAALIVTLAVGVSTVPTLAAPLFPSFQEAGYELMAAEKSGSKVASTKAWVKRKTSETGRWMGRQKEKIKRLAD